MTCKMCAYVRLPPPGFMAGCPVCGTRFDYRGQEAGRAEPDALAGCGLPADNDPVNHPAHYTASGIECIDAIEAALTPEEFRGYCKGNALKYIWRERLKGGTESVFKANWYLNRLTESESRERAANGPELPLEKEA